MRGWNRVRGKGPVRYRNPSGKIVSRAEYDNARARKAGFRNYYDYRKTRKSDDFIRWQRDAIENRSATRRDFSLEGDFVTKYQAAKRSRNRRDPDGPLADFLVYIGLRQPDWEWDIGDTPKMEGSK